MMTMWVFMSSDTFVVVDLIILHYALWAHVRCVCVHVCVCFCGCDGSDEKRIE